MLGKKGQVTIFVIIAILVVVAGVLIFTFRDEMRTEKVPVSIEPVKTSFLECVETKTNLGISVLEANGGFIESPEFVPGTRYQPFSNKLAVGGQRIPYWYYLSGSGIEKEQVPTIDFMEEQFERFLEVEVLECDLDLLRDEGYSIKVGEPLAKVKIDRDFVQVDLELDLAVEKNLESAILRDHNIRINSKLGRLYEMSQDIYDKEMEEYFLEEFTIDVLRLYAPVDGVELSCSPMIWNGAVIYNDITEALEVNFGALNNQGRDDDYFTLDFNNDVSTRFTYSKDWPTYMEINPTSGDTLIAKPVGNQEGMGILGFCYVPYHFVYDFRHPVLVQVSEGGETFQFPIVLSVDGNLPRKSRATQTQEGIESDVCEFSNTMTKVSVYDGDLRPVDGRVTFECFQSSCELGMTQEGEVEGLLPQCVNGVIRVNADGFKESKTIYSSIEEGNPIVILEREYDKDFDVVMGGELYKGNGVLTLAGEDVTVTALLSEAKTLRLSPGKYEATIYLYSDSKIELPATTKETCVKVPRSGVLGLAGLKKNSCSTVEIPEQLITSALIGGGTGTYTFSEEELKTTDRIQFIGGAITVPKTLEELQNNYILSDINELEVVVL